MDLNSSTSIAEELGHKRYSRFIQDCYRLLTKPLRITQGEVYQFVGDEVVVSWEVIHGLKDTRCLDFYYAYMDALNKNRAFRYFSALNPDFCFSCCILEFKCIIKQIVKQLIDLN